MHRCEPIFGAVADAFPDPVLSCDQEGEALADSGKSSEGSNVGDCSLEEYFDEDFRGDFCNRARKG